MNCFKLRSIGKGKKWFCNKSSTDRMIHSFCLSYVIATTYLIQSKDIRFVTLVGASVLSGCVALSIFFGVQLRISAGAFKVEMNDISQQMKSVLTDLDHRIQNLDTTVKRLDDTVKNMNDSLHKDGHENHLQLIRVHANLRHHEQMILELSRRAGYSPNDTDLYNKALEQNDCEWNHPDTKRWYKLAEERWRRCDE